VLTIPEEEIDTRFQGRRVLHTRKVPILDGTGQPAFLLGISDDITDIKQAEASKPRSVITLYADVKSERVNRVALARPNH
jgi:hypothetical protein